MATVVLKFVKTHISETRQLNLASSEDFRCLRRLSRPLFHLGTQALNTVENKTKQKIILSISPC